MDAQELYIEANGQRFHLYDWGGAGQPLLLLHGLASNARIWDFVAPLLARTARVVAVDQRGHGLSSKPDGGYDFSSVVADLAALTGALDFVRPIVVGHSWGASVAVAYAAQHPDAPAGIALVDGGYSSPSTQGWDWDEALKHLAPPRIAGTPRETLLGWIRNGDLKETWRPETEAIILAGFDQHADGTIAPRLTYEHHLAIVRALWETDVLAVAGAVRCPVLLLPSIRAAKDDVARKQTLVADAAARFSNARFVSTVWLEDAIHDVPLQRPERVAEALSAFVAAAARAG
jgi:pimeloyl-ACP methyl ester carboxylesterase